MTYGKPVPTDLLFPLSEPSASIIPPSPSCLPRRSDKYPESEPFRDLDTNLSHWSVQTHVFPAASPRVAVGSAVPRGQLRGSSGLATSQTRLSKAEAIAGADAIWTRNLTARRRDSEKALDELRSDVEEELWIACNRYYSTRPSTRDGLTLVFAHANGLMKETWEPTIAHLLASDAGKHIEEIFCLDAVNQGDSGILNRASLGAVFDWQDNGRDILQFLVSYLPQSTFAPRSQSASRDSDISASVPLGSNDPQTAFVLPRQPLVDAMLLQLDQHPGSPADPLGETPNCQAQPNRTWRGRKVVLVGHSLGGAGSAFALTSLPQLLYATVFVDPVIVPESLNRDDPTHSVTVGASVRRDTWSSKGEAQLGFAKNASFFGKWDPRVLDRYVDFALVDEREGSNRSPALVTLKCGKDSEASVFADGNRRSTHAFNRLANMPPSHPNIPPVRFIFAGTDMSVIPEMFIQEMTQRLSWASVTRVEGSGHLIAQEAPVGLANQLGAFLGTLPGQWKAKL